MEAHAVSPMFRSIHLSGDLFQIALPAISANALNRRCHMAEEVDKFSTKACKSAFYSRFERILFITAAYYGLSLGQGATYFAEGNKA